MRRTVAALSIFAGFLIAQDSRNWLNQGVSQYKAGNYISAIENFQKAVDADPSFATAHLYLASAMAQQFVPGMETPENTRNAEMAIQDGSQKQKHPPRWRCASNDLEP